MSIEAMKLALEALKGVYQYGSDTLSGPVKGQPDDRKWQRDGVLEMTNRAYKGIKALEEALNHSEDNLDMVKQKRPQNCGTSYCSCIECVMGEQEQGEPVAWLVEFENGEQELHFDEQAVGEKQMPLYTTPQQRTWVGLTKDELSKLLGTYIGRKLAQAIEAKLKEKNT